MTFFEVSNGKFDSDSRELRMGLIVVEQLVNSGMPRSLIKKLQGVVQFQEDRKLKIHRHQLARKIPGHIQIFSIEDVRKILGVIAAEGYSMEFLGSYGYRYDDMSINDQNNEVVKEREPGYECSSWFASAVAVSKDNKKFIFGLVANWRHWNTSSKKSDFTKNINYMINHFSSDVKIICEKFSKYPKKFGISVNSEIDEFISNCRDSLKNK